MIPLEIVIILCVMGFCAGVLIGEETEHNRCMDQMEVLKKFYHEKTNSLVEYIKKINGQKGGK